MSRFDRAVAIVLKHEGGLEDDPQDHASITNFGISLRAYPSLGREGIRLLTRTQATAIYHRDYWEPIKGDDLPWPLAMVTFDAAVNSGVHKASQWLQLVVETTPDGVIGPLTVNAAFLSDNSNACRAYTDLRIEYLKTLDNWKHFGGGWTEHCYDTLKEALS